MFRGRGTVPFDTLLCAPEHRSLLLFRFDAVTDTSRDSHPVRQAIEQFILRNRRPQRHRLKIGKHDRMRAGLGVRSPLTQCVQNLPLLRRPHQAPSSFRTGIFFTGSQTVIIPKDLQPSTWRSLIYGNEWYRAYKPGPIPNVS